MLKETETEETISYFLLVAFRLGGLPPSLAMPMGVDSILIDPVVPEIFYFKLDFGTSYDKYMIFIGSPYADSLSVLATLSQF